MKKFKKGNKRNQKQKADNRPKEIRLEDVGNITLHFKERWNERVSEISMKNFREVFYNEYGDETLKKIDGDYYLIGDVMVVMGFKDGYPALVTCIGSIEDNYMTYDLLESRGAKYYNNFMKRYGKIRLTTVA